MNFAELFPDEDFRFHMAMQRGKAEDFFQHTAGHAALMAERRRWFASEPKVYSAALPQCEPLLDEFIELARSWETAAMPDFSPPSTGGWKHTARPDNVALPVRCIGLGESWEPDFLLLKANANGVFHLLGGCVAFPSSWSLEEKVGKPMEFIHGRVPGLNSQLGQSIQSFLSKLQTNSNAWLRHNWGLSRSRELNQHPRRTLPRLDASVMLDEVWLRIERQALMNLPRSGGVLFGIRIELHPLANVKEDTVAAQRLARALRTMPGEAAAYKGLATARERLLELLGR